MSKAGPGAPAETAALYDKLVATIPDVKRKGDTVPYTSVNGNMFSYLSKTGTVGLRLPEPERQAFLEKYNTKLCEQYGVVQVEYVEVPDMLLAQTSELQPFFATSYGYVSALKPKPTTRPKSAKAAKTAKAARAPKTAKAPRPAKSPRLAKAAKAAKKTVRKAAKKSAKRPAKKSGKKR